jgi:hypothetical protein
MYLPPPTSKHYGGHDNFRGMSCLPLTPVPTEKCDCHFVLQPILYRITLMYELSELCVTYDLS